MNVPVWKMSGHLNHLSNHVSVGPDHSTDPQPAVAFLLNLGDHFLEGGTAPYGLINLGGDAFGNTLDAFLDKGLALCEVQERLHGFSPSLKRLLSTIAIQTSSFHYSIYSTRCSLEILYLCVENCCRIQKCITDVMHAISVTG